MAYQGYRSKDDTTVGRPSELPVKTGGENLTPAPLSTADLTRRKDVAWGRAGDQPQDQNSGRNGFGGASSLPVGTKAPDATIRATANTDLVMDAILKGGAKGAQASDDWQVRSIDSNPGVATAHGMSRRGPADGSPGATIPAKIGALSGDEQARRAAALTRAGGK